MNWLLHTDAGLLTRVAAGVGVFTVLGLIDLRRNGRAATRWREYGVLVACVLAALAYGAVNDQVTVTISPEYFLYGKELAKTVGDPPASELALRWAAAVVGLKATWSAGLLIGVVLLLANNPWRSLPRLPNRRLIGLLPVILLCAATLAVVGGVVGHAGLMTHWQADFEDQVRADLWRPRRYMATWGVHLGGYAGGLIGTAWAAALVIRRRGRLRSTVTDGRAFDVRPITPAG